MKTVISTGKNKKFYFLICLLLVLSGCSDTFLDAKPDSKIVVPRTLDDCRRLLYHNNIASSFPALSVLGADEYYYDLQAWQATDYAVERNSYVWADDVYEGQADIIDWSASYRAIYMCNVVLNVLQQIPRNSTNGMEWDYLKGAALFWRAFRYYKLAEVFTMPYMETTAANELGLPLRESSNIDYVAQRASLEETYQMMLNDLLISYELVSTDAPTADDKETVSKAAVTALLANIYLTMHNYPKALQYAELSLSHYDRLLDYNDLTLDNTNTFDEKNGELLIWALMYSYRSIQPGDFAPNTYVDNRLMELYRAEDLRKEAFYSKNDEIEYQRKRMYAASATQTFAGLSTNEVYLILAECQTRLGNDAEAANTLRILLQNRYANGNVPTLDDANLLATILNERRKELPFRSARWMDARRLNVEGANIVLQHMLGASTFKLEPNSPKYAFPIPINEISGSGIKQNKR